MSLLHPTAGEIADRLSILVLKIKAAQEKKIDYGHFTREYDQLEAALDSSVSLLAGPDKVSFDNFYSELRKANAVLWDLEDDIRALLRKAHDARGRAFSRGFALAQTFPIDAMKELVEVAFAIPVTNDIRADMVKRINGLFGEALLEKVYS